MGNAHIRPAEPRDAIRLAEIEIFNYRLHFYPIFQSDAYYFDALRVDRLARRYGEDPALIARTRVYDDGVVKGFLRLDGREVEKLFVEPALQGRGIGARLLEDAIARDGADSLWALEKNARAIAFYARHGFYPNGERSTVDDTVEYLIKLVRS